MANVKFIAVSRGLRGFVDYVTNREKTVEQLISGANCVARTAVPEFEAAEKQFHKTEGRGYYHIVQAFAPDDPLDFTTAHELGVKLAEHFKGYQCIVVTHMNTAHIHNHNTRNIQLGESDSAATLYHELVRGQFSENIEVTGSIFLPGDDVRGAYDSAGIIATNADYSTKYLAVLWYGSNLEREFHITKQTDTDTFIATLPAPDVQLNNSYWVKIRIENGSIYAKYWLNDGQTLEPAAWMLTATLEPNWSATGGVGFVANATKTWAKWLWVTAA